MASISDSSTNLGVSVASLTLGLPANTSAQALILIVSAEAGSAPTINTPSGWTALPVGQSTGTVVSSAVYYKAGDGSASVIITTAATAFWIAAAALVIDDADLSALINASGKTSASVATSHPATSSSLTTSAASCLVIGVWGFGYSGTVNPTPAAGMNAEVLIESGSAGANLSLLVGS